MRTLLRICVCSIILLAAAVVAESRAAERDEVVAKRFSDDVAPILVGSCLECHGAERQGGLDLRTRATAIKGGENGAALVPGDPDDSLLFDYVSNHEMPPKHPLDETQIAVVKRWIEDGAYYPEQPLDPFARTTKHRAGRDWWALRPLVAPKLPEVDGLPPAWQGNAIDRFVFEKLQAEKLSPSAPADPRTLIRRATFDLIGLPPTPEEVEDFVAKCAQETGDSKSVGPQAYAALLDRLLASERYGEHWGRHWLDVVRFGESNGFEKNVITTNAWPFRDYIIRSLNADKPFDRLIKEHLAGDVLAPRDPDVAVGTAFLVCGPYDNVNNQDPVQREQIRADTIDEMIRATSDAFLGLTVGCSRCHDHKFDPISQHDYYSLYATFAGVHHGERAIPRQQDEETKRRISAIEAELAKRESRLQSFEPVAALRETIVLDDEMRQSTSPTKRGVQLLRAQRGHGSNPPGAGRGYRGDVGGVNRMSNVSRGRYRWWDAKPGVDTFVWNPAAQGKFRVWLSWGCGMHLHSIDAQYWLDADGDLKTKDDQTLIATVDQQRFAGGGSGTLPRRALWSGFLDAGVHAFGPQSRIVLRCGKTGKAVTADVIVLQREAEKAPAQPRLRRPVRATLNVDRFAPVRAKLVRFNVHATNSAEPCLDELEIYAVGSDKNVALQARATSSGNYQDNPKHTLRHINDGKYGNSHSWISGTAGRGWVELELAEELALDRVVWARDREGEFDDRLAVGYRIEVAQERGKWQTVASSADRLPPNENGYNRPILFGLSEDEARQAKEQLAAVAAPRKELDALRKVTPTPKWWIGNFRQADGPFHVFQRGSPQNRGEVVLPTNLSFVDLPEAEYKLAAQLPESKRRLALAEWIVAPEQPLTPRVLANRMWHYHFGAGIVNTPSDLGFMGGRPSHPELLDWLATELKRHGWRLKPLHKQIMLSQTYRQASTFRADAAKIDGDSRWLWRYPPRRLTAEEIRDAILTVTGKLDTKMGGPGFRLFRYVRDNVATYHPLDEHPPETYRRAVYHHNARAMQIDIMTEFDAPDCAFSTPRRATTTTPLQALSLLNHKFTVDMAQALAQRVKREAGDDRDAQVQRAFALAFFRQAHEAEVDAAQKLIAAHGLRAFCRALLNASEMIYVN